MARRGVIQRPMLYDLLMQPLEWLAFERRRRGLFHDLHGEVLELGTGTGRNLDNYCAAARVTAFDVEPSMVRAAAGYARAKGAQVLVADAHCLPFPTAAFDHVTATLVFCSIPNPTVALAEVARVLRPGGRLIMLEHTRTDRALPNMLLDRIEPAWKIMTGGCMVNRDTTGLLDRLGWRLQRHERYLGGLVRVVEALPPPTRFALG